MKSKDQQRLEEAYSQIRQNQQLNEDAGKALRSYSNAGDNTLQTFADLFSQAFGMVGSMFGSSSKGEDGPSQMSLEKAVAIRDKIAKGIESNPNLSYDRGGVPVSAKPHLLSLLAKLDGSIKQAEEAAKSYSESGLFGKLFKSKGDSVSSVEATPDEMGAAQALERA